MQRLAGMLHYIAMLSSGPETAKCTRTKRERAFAGRGSGPPSPAGSICSEYLNRQVLPYMKIVKWAAACGTQLL